MYDFVFASKLITKDKSVYSATLYVGGVLTRLFAARVAMGSYRFGRKGDFRSEY